MTRKQQPQPTNFQKIGGSIYLKIPSDRVKFLGLEHLKEEGNNNIAEAKCQAEKNSKGERYISSWNPNQESQKRE